MKTASPLQRWDSQKQFDTENEELVDVEDEEEDEDDSEFFDESSDDVLDEE